MVGVVVDREKAGAEHGGRGDPHVCESQETTIRPVAGQSSLVIRCFAGHSHTFLALRPLRRPPRNRRQRRTHSSHYANAHTTSFTFALSHSSTRKPMQLSGAPPIDLNPTFS